MLWPKRLPTRVRALFQKKLFEGEMDEELRFHLESMIQDNTRAGVSREEARPVRIARERVRVEVRRHVAATTGVRVLEPGAADGLVALADDEVLNALLPKPHAEADAGEPGAHDADAMVLGAHGTFALASRPCTGSGGRC